jgi:hypothetical protein
LRTVADETANWLLIVEWTRYPLLTDRVEQLQKQVWLSASGRRALSGELMLHHFAQ